MKIKWMVLGLAWWVVLSPEGLNAAPSYGPSKDIPNAVMLVFSTQTREEKGTFRIERGGSAVFGIEVPLNATDLVLHLKSTGAVKVSISQPGTAESIELGFTLVWEEDLDKDAIPHGHELSLDDFIMRWPKRKNLRYSYLTCNNLYFIQIHPSANQEVVVESVRISGAVPIDLPIPKPNTLIKTRSVTKGIFTLQEWNHPVSAKKWWGQKSLPAGKETVLAEIPFKVSPLVPDENEKSLAVEVGQKAGLIHLVHTADQPQNGRDWVASYTLEYEGGARETLFVNLGWNCGTYSGVAWTDATIARTWWGPPGFPAAKVHYLSQPGLGGGWNGVYVTTYRNPHPEKVVKRLTVTSTKAGSFALLGLTLTAPETSFIGLVEPEEAVLYPERKTRISAMVWSAIPFQNLKSGTLYLTKPGKKSLLGKIQAVSKGSFGFGKMEVVPSKELMCPGPVTLEFEAAGRILARSSLLGWMPARSPSDQPYAFTMISSGREPRGELERIRRLGFDAVKALMGWREVEPEPGTFTWEKWKNFLTRIHREGLMVEFRNRDKVLPEWLGKKVSRAVCINTGELAKEVELTDPDYLEAIIRYYREVARFASKYPYVRSLNTSYMTHSYAGLNGMLYCGPDRQIQEFQKYLQSHFSLGEIRSRTKLNISRWNEIAASKILEDQTGFLFVQFVRFHNETAGDLQRKVVQGIRQAGYPGHLTFNVAYHYQIQRLAGFPFDQYLQMGREYPPLSPFHETSDRYCLSFSKWLAAKRTFNLPYGDEGGQNPPTYEQNVRAYQWMLMMQCWDAIYCQWWNGIPASQNIAWLKPYYDLVYRSEYLPDPFSLTLSFESGFEEAWSMFQNKNKHGPAMSHFGLVIALRTMNFNADRYVMDRFPETDNRPSKLWIDDVSRYIDDSFANRIEKYMKNGGTFLATWETDRLRQGAFLKRFGVTVEPVNVTTSFLVNGRSVNLPGAKFKILGDGINSLGQWTNGSIAVGARKVGRGQLVIMGTGWNQESFENNLPEPFLKYLSSMLGRLGSFRPNVVCNKIDINVTPYRTPSGSILVLVFNNSPATQSVEVSLRKDLLPILPKVKVLDLGTDGDLNVRESGGYWRVTTSVAPIHSTLLEFVPDDRNTNL
jgi:hypothetical protein